MQLRRRGCPKGCGDESVIVFPFFFLFFSIHQNRWITLQHAAKTGSTEICQKVIAAGVSVNRADGVS